MRLDKYKELVVEFVEIRKMTHAQVSEFIKQQYGETRSPRFGEWSVRQFCRIHGIKSGGKVSVTNDQLTTAISSAVDQVCFFMYKISFSIVMCYCLL